MALAIRRGMRWTVLTCLAAVLAAVVLNRQLARKPEAWHEGPEWEAYLELYDKWVSYGFQDCEGRRVVTDFGSTQVYACGNSSHPPVMAHGGAASSSIIYTNWVLPPLVESGRFVLAVDYICDLGRSRPLDGNTTYCPATQYDFVVRPPNCLIASLSVRVGSCHQSLEPS